MNKEKDSAGVSQANVPGVPRVVVSSERAKPAEPGKKRLRRIVIALGAVVIFAMVCVVMNESNDYLRTLIEETRLRPHMERIFGKDAKFGIEFKLCEKGNTSLTSFANLSRAMDICKRKTKGMTEDKMLDSYDELYHNYDLYIYDPDGQSVETDDEKLRVIKRLREVIKYLPDGRLDIMHLEYYVKNKNLLMGGGGFWVRVSDLSPSRNIPQLVRQFSDGVLMNTATHIPDWGNYYPIRKGWDK
ncbi:hypothetical protein [Candidatus Nanoperiomorbus periodonticus]|uniref:hypothetical protein n=1 Tax=Candidatus Nanoperiomorbus periodonticus TaxID=2171989 RepID=UPI00101C8ECF|nr:hypothetical protein [Candidatus Nanoperiomorbus periodonticus]RYC75913.1 hypothetical protein G52EAM_00158 [Candidatus Nanoperiomorbus periodonticus]